MKRVGVQEILLLNKKEEYILKCRNKKAYQTKMEIIPKLYKKLKEKDRRLWVELETNQEGSKTRK